MPSQQQNLFDTEPAEWEIDVREQRLVATIILGEGPKGDFDYLVPSEFCDPDRAECFLQPGRRVRVPFGRSNRRVVGYCVQLETKSVDPGRFKQVAEVVDASSLLSAPMLRLTRWMAEYYLSSWGQVLEAVVPAGVRKQAGTREVGLLQVPEDVLHEIARVKLPAKQRQALDFLASHGKPLTSAQLAEAVGCTTAPIRQLLKKGLVETKRVRVASRVVEEQPMPREAPLSLNADQQRAFEAIDRALESGEAHGIVVHGVTGSGKTEVYLQAIDRVVGFGRQAIVLVPEISLTPQTERRFRSRFDSVAVLHSHLTEVERHEQWQRIVRGEVQVVVGARSAVFAPTPHLGLIVIDEEHESTFKQDSAPRYHARDVAWQRAVAEKIPLVLGSATPSLESWHRSDPSLNANSEHSDWQRVAMPRRVMNRPLPDVALVDLRDPVQSRGGRGGISRVLHQAMAVALADRGQIILLLNRRGFSTHIQCPACGFVVACPNCEMPLTFHRQQQRALCHYCDYFQTPPTDCPDCKSHAIRYGGLGTQKLEDEVRARFPKHVTARMDTDSMRARGSHEQVLDRFGSGEIDILLGTQMIAKGLDFPNVTLVGVVNADTALHLPDFRAGERTFQLVAQVAGRTGRGEKGGRVLVQTFSPEHAALQAAVRHDFPRFATQELAMRKQLLYPPFGAMIRLVVRGPSEEVTRSVAEDLADRLKQAGGDQTALRVMGAAPASIAKLRNNYRFQIHLHSAKIGFLRNVVDLASTKFKPPRDIVWTVDVDPTDMM